MSLVRHTLLILGILLMVALAVGLTGFVYPLGPGWPDEVLDYAGILIVLGSVMLPARAEEGPGPPAWWRRADLWAVAGGTALVAGWPAPAGLLLAGAALAAAGGRHRRAGGAADANTPLARRARAAWTERGGLLLLVAALLLLLESWEDATSPGGPKAYRVELGVYGILVALLGVAWAARMDGRRALGAGVTEAWGQRPGAPQRLFLAGLLPFGGFLFLWWLIRLPAVQAWDVRQVHGFYLNGGEAANRVMRGVSRAGGFSLLLYWFPVVALLLAVSRRIRSILFCSATLFGVFGAETVSKALAYRLRPDLNHGRHFDSFPSGHTLAATLLAGALLLVLLPPRRRPAARAVVWMAALSWALVMGASRVYLGRHYVTDVAGALLLGTAWVTWCLALFLAVAPAPEEAGTGRSEHLHTQ